MENDEQIGLDRMDRQEIAKELQRLFMPIAREITFTIAGNEIFIHVRAKKSLAEHPRKKIHFHIRDWNIFDEETIPLP